LIYIYDINVIVIKTIKMAGGACPYQLEAITEDGKWLYLRYRGGMLRYVLADSETEWFSGKHYTYDFNKKIGNDLDGWADHDTIYPHIKDHIQLPEGFKLKSYE
jgi:hypothetical protein